MTRTALRVYQMGHGFMAFLWDFFLIQDAHNGALSRVTAPEFNDHEKREDCCW